MTNGPVPEANRGKEAARSSTRIHFGFQGEQTPFADPRINAHQLRILGNGVTGFMNKCVQDGITTAVFFDTKSRPAALIFRDVWRKTLGKQGIPMPKIRFVNNGRREMDPDGDAANAARVKEAPQVLPKRFGTLADERVCLVDDTSVSGQTMRNGKAAFDAAFPQAEQISQHILFTGLPFWDSNGTNDPDSLGVGRLFHASYEEGKPSVSDWTAASFLKRLDQARKNTIPEDTYVEGDPTGPISAQQHRELRAATLQRMRALRSQLHDVSDVIVANSQIITPHK